MSVNSTAETLSPGTLAALSIPLACFVFGLKYWSYLLTGSVALYSDALESVVNIIAAAAALWAVCLSRKPADSNHPFGHHKAEYFSAVFEGLLIIAAACLILLQAWGALRNPAHHLQQPQLGLVINALAGALNAVWATVLIRCGRRRRSPALEADGRHLMTDVITSFGVIAGLLAALFTGITLLDPLLAIAVALQILWQGFRLFYRSAQGLMDIGLAPAQTEQIRALICRHAAGALEAHDLRSRVAGQIIFLEFHLVVPAAMTVGAAHKICDNIERALHKKLGLAHIIIHVEPENEAKKPRCAAAKNSAVTFV